MRMSQTNTNIDGSARVAVMRTTRAGSFLSRLALTAAVVIPAFASADEGLRFPPEARPPVAPPPYPAQGPAPGPFWNARNIPLPPPQGQRPPPRRPRLYGELPDEGKQSSGNGANNRPPPQAGNGGPRPPGGARGPYGPPPPWANGPGRRDHGPFGRKPFGRNGVFGRSPSNWFRGGPKEGLANMWEDMINAPSRMGEMPPGWSFPEVSVPNPVDVGDQFGVAGQDAAKEAPDFMREIPDMFSFQPY